MSTSEANVICPNPVCGNQFMVPLNETGKRVPGAIVYYGVLDHEADASEELTADR